MFSEAIAQCFFAPALRIAQWQSLISDDHFTVDGTMIEAWASIKSFVKKDGGGHDPTVDVEGEKRPNDTPRYAKSNINAEKGGANP